MLTHAHPFPTRWTQVSLAFLGVLAGIGGCTEEVPGPQAILPTEVTAVTLTPKDIPATYGFVGKTESTRKVEIRPLQTSNDKEDRTVKWFYQSCCREGPRSGQLPMGPRSIAPPRPGGGDLQALLNADDGLALRPLGVELLLRSTSSPWPA